MFPFLIFGQVTFLVETERVHAGIYLNNDSEALRSCVDEKVTVGNKTQDVVPQPQQCSTSIYQPLAKGDRVCIKTEYTGRTVLTKRQLTFWEMAVIRD